MSRQCDKCGGSGYVILTRYGMPILSRNETEFEQGRCPKCIDGEPLDALQIITRDRDEWKRRALEAEAKVSQLEQCVRELKCECGAGQWCHICDPCSRHRAKLREVEASLAEADKRNGDLRFRLATASEVVEAETIARVVAMIRFRHGAVINWTSEDVSRLITDIECGEWRKEKER